MSRFQVFAPVRRVLLLVGIAFAAIPVGSALADTTVGQTGGGFNCQSTKGSVLVDTNYVVPSAGLITSFSFQSAEGNIIGGPIDFLVLRPGSDGSYSIVGGTGLVNVLNIGLVTFPANIPVQSGDILGSWSGASVFYNCAHETFGSGGGFATATVQTNDPPKIGDTITFNKPVPGLDLNESANLRAVGSPPPTPTSKAQCKKGGWQTFGGMFKNQGDCVSYVATGGKNPSSGS